MLVSGLISAVFEPGGFIFSTILIMGGCAFLAGGILRHRQYSDSPESDERSKKIGAYGHSQVGNTGRTRALCDGTRNFRRALSDVPVSERGC